MKKLFPLILLSLSVSASATTSFSTEQQKEIEIIAADYLREHPELLVEMSQKLQQQAQDEQNSQIVSAVLNNQNALLNEPTSPVLNPKGAVAVIQFFDYQCIYCAKVAPVVEQFITRNPDVRYIYKEWPIFGNRWPASVEAAKTGLGVYRERGADAYHRYHAAIYDTGHNEGKLTGDDIRTAAAKAGVKDVPDNIADGGGLAANQVLAKRLQIQGTPAFIVMPVQGANTGNVSFIGGAAELSTLQAAYDKARGN